MLRRYLAALADLFFGIALCIGGVFFAAFWWSESFRQFTSQLLLEYPWVLFLLSGLLLIIGSVFIGKVFFRFQKRSYVLSKGDRSVTINETIFENYLKKYWQQEFPNLAIPFSISIKPTKILIEAELNAESDEKDRSAIIEKIENDLTSIYQSFLGYTGEVRLTLLQTTKK